MSTQVSLGPLSGGDGATTLAQIIVRETGPDLSGPQDRIFNTMLNSFSCHETRTITTNNNTDTTITLPTTPAPAGVIIEMPSDNVATVTFRDNTQTGGARGCPKGVEVRTFDQNSLPTSIIIKTSAAVAGVRIYFW